MNIGSLMSLFPGLSGTVDAAKDAGSANSNPLAFLQALLQQFQGVQAGTDQTLAEGTAGQGAAKPDPGQAEGGLVAFLEQLKVLASQTALTSVDKAAGASADGKPVDAAGKPLPSGALPTASDAAQPPTAEQLAQWLAQWLPSQGQAACQSQGAGEQAATAAFASTAVPVGDPLAMTAGAQTVAVVAEEGQAGGTDALNEARIKSAFSQLIARASQGGDQPAGTEGAGDAVAAVKPGANVPAVSSPAAGVTVAGATSAGAAGTAAESPDQPASSVLKAEVLGLDASAAANNHLASQTLTADAGGTQPIPMLQSNAQAVPARQIVAPTVQTPLGHPGWSEDLGQHVVWMSGQGVQAAEIRLNPAHLGPLEVRINLSQDQQATVQFTSHHAAVREAIESAIPKLREMMSAQNLNLGEVNVSSQSFSDRESRGPAFGFGEQPAGGRPGHGQANDGGHPLYGEGEAGPAPARNAAQGLLSLYA
jgi:flagellar hook-length control protein FliK